MSGCGIEQIAVDTVVSLGEDYTFRAEDFFLLDQGVRESDLSVDASAVDTTAVGEYPVTVTYGWERYVVHVAVVDWKAPSLEMTEKCYFTNNLDDIEDQTFAVYQDDSECLVCVGGYERIEGLDALTEEDIADLTSSFATQELGREKLSALVGEDRELSDVPTREVLGLLLDETPPDEEGVYLARVAVADIWNNVTEGSLLLVYDTTAPVAEGLADVEVVQEDASALPDLDLSAVRITDNLDGEIPREALDVQMTQTDRENHVYRVSLSCEDRAGNRMEDSYSITVKEAKRTPSRPPQTFGTAPQETEPSAASSPEGDVPGVFLEQQVEQVLERINAEREAEGLSALSLNGTATSAAQIRAVEIVDSFSHVRPNGNRGYTTLLDVGIQYTAAGENLAIGYNGSAEAVVSAWMKSETHRANIMRDYTDIGIACYYDPNTPEKYYWVQLFFR